MFEDLKVILGLLGCGLVLGCASLREAAPKSETCTPAVVAQINAEYAAQVIAACPDKATRKACPYIATLREIRDQAERDARCF